MKAYVLIIFLICTSLQAQNNFSQTSGNQIDYFKSNPNDLKDVNGNNIFNSSGVDSLIFIGGPSFGGSISSAGDVNGDGYSDVIVGNYNDNHNRGRAYIYYGGILMDNIADVSLADNYTFGISVSTAGDVNGDGYSDVIVGASQYESAFIFYGNTTMDNNPDVILYPGLGGEFGHSVSTAGDVNGDGYSDVIVGASAYNSNTGRMYVYFGGSSMDNVPDFSRTGIATNSYYGWSVSTAGDVNGDGFSDVIIGASGNQAAYLFNNILPKPVLINPNNNSVNIPNMIDFKWRKINSAIFYNLLVSTDSIFNNIIINDTIYTDTSKTVIEFRRGVKFFWKVKAIDTSGITHNSSVWNFTVIPPINVNLKLLFEGMYSPSFNQLIRMDSVTAYLRQSVPPFILLDSTIARIDSLTFTGFFNFYNALTGTYYISVKHFNSIETWSKSGGEYLATDGTIYNYDFTNANTQAYGNNLKLKGSKYCLYSGDINQDGYITLFDVIPIYNDATSFVAGRYIKTDLTGDNVVDLTDVTIGYNNSANFISKITP